MSEPPSEASPPPPPPPPLPLPFTPSLTRLAHRLGAPRLDDPEVVMLVAVGRAHVACQAVGLVDSEDKPVLTLVQLLRGVLVW